jgi:hypothetical protein
MDCKVNEFSSRICGRGTKGCNTRHANESTETYAKLTQAEVSDLARKLADIAEFQQRGSGWIPSEPIALILDEYKILKAT